MSSYECFQTKIQSNLLCTSGMEEGVGVEGRLEKGRVEKEEGWYIEDIRGVPRKEMY